MTTNIKLPKPTIGNDEDLTLKQLLNIPSKRRLEILFASNIIPCRRQLAIKFNSSEKLIHNVLSHRWYILENWKYNGDAKEMLSKTELENTMAMIEILIEWKRRVQLNSLQMTEVALKRKASYLQRVLNITNVTLSDKWWEQFNINWEFKNFQDYQNDSLEMEDILNDLKWMFSENAFRRLMLKLQLAKSGQRFPAGGIDDNSSVVIKTEQQSSNEMEENFDICDFQPEPHNHENDDSDCEDYEFVLDEEVIIEELRKELNDAEQTKYQRFMVHEEDKNYKEIKDEKLIGTVGTGTGTGTGNERKNLKTEEDDFENIMLHNENDMNSDLGATSMLCSNASTSLVKYVDPDPSSEPLSTDDLSYTDEIDFAASANASDQSMLQKPIPKPKPRKGKSNVRKDCVRPSIAETETSQLPTKNYFNDCFGGENDTSSYDEIELSNNWENSKRRKNCQKSKLTRGIKHNATANEKSISPSMIVPDEPNSNDYVDDQYDFEISGNQSNKSVNSHFFNNKNNKKVKNKSAETDILENFECVASFNNTSSQLPTTKEINNELNEEEEEEDDDDHMNNFAKNLGRSRRSTNKKTIKNTENQKSKSFKYESDMYQMSNAKAIENFDIQDEIDRTTEKQKKKSRNITGTQTKIVKQRLIRTCNVVKTSFKKPSSIEMASPSKEQESIPIIKQKRAKRRTDDSDLTLRKDKVRLSLVRLPDLHMVLKPVEEGD